MLILGGLPESELIGDNIVFAIAITLDLESSPGVGIEPHLGLDVVDKLLVLEATVLVNDQVLVETLEQGLAWVSKINDGSLLDVIGPSLALNFSGAVLIFVHEGL